jgi:3-hydroxyacyl-[acyl-carrier-protein] dehydratase
MPPSLLFDISNIDLSKVLLDQTEVNKFNPQRSEFEMLNGILWVDEPEGRIVGFKDVKHGEFWERGHIPGRPIFPGVLQLELAAQVAALYTAKYVGWTGFIGFGGAEDVKFRGQVLPGCRLIVLAQKIWERHRRISCRTQGLVNGNLVFEATIIGVQL